MTNARKRVRKEEAEQRARELLKQMTLREKVGQLNQHLYGFNAYERTGESISPAASFIKEADYFGGIGVLYGLYRADPWSAKTYENGLYGKKAIRAYNTLQEYLLKNTRLKIPMMVSSESPHGHQALDGYLLPVNLASGATFDPELVSAGFGVAARQQRELGVDLCLLSLLDICRDPRWGRTEECFGEDPYLSASMAGSVTKAVEGEGLVAVAKCLAGQGETTGGVNASAARIGEREVREIHLPAMRACAKNGAQGVMAAYNEIDGVYCCANPKLLNDILRGEFGFDGIVMADGLALDNLDRMTGDTEKSAALALHSGIDLSLWDTAFTKLESAVNKGYVSESYIDRSVLRILTMKFERGLFDQPYLEEEAPATSFTVDKFPQTLQLARESAVLLKNDGVLPLGKNVKAALISPAAEDIYAMLGDYTPPVKPGTYVTLLEGMKKSAARAGSEILASKGSDPQQVRQTIADSDVVILALGGSSSRFNGADFDANGAAITSGRTRMDCGEGVDLAQLELSKDQRELAALVLDTAKEKKKKVICLLTGGRPYVPGRLLEGNALLYAFYPGPYGGQALGEIVFGQVDPSGRLPVSVPVAAGQLPVCYNAKASYVRHYTDVSDSPAFTFGDGLSYSHFAFQDCKLSTDTLPDSSDSLTLSFTLTNTSTRAGAAVPLLFFRCRQGTVTRRVKELGAFTKVFLGPGESKHVELMLKAESLCEWDAQMKRTLTPTQVHLSLEESGEPVFTCEIKAGREASESETAAPGKEMTCK